MSEQKHHFPDGALVRLNSGGPAMTVQNCRTDDYVGCCWFDGAQVQFEAFDYRCLKAATVPAGAKGE